MVSGRTVSEQVILDYISKGHIQLAITETAKLHNISKIAAKQIVLEKKQKMNTITADTLKMFAKSLGIDLLGHEIMDLSFDRKYMGGELEVSMSPSINETDRIDISVRNISRSSALTFARSLATARDNRPQEDVLFTKAIEIAKEGHPLKPALLQRRLGVNYNIAQELVRRLVSRGYKRAW